MSKKTTPKRGTKTAGKQASKNLELKKHLPTMKAVHPELRRLVNSYLEEKNIPLKVAAMHFTSEAVDDYNCCTINGMVVCGPQCP